DPGCQRRTDTQTKDAAGAARRAPETRPAGCAQHPAGCFIKPMDEVIMPTADTNVNGRSVLDDQDQRLRDGADCLAAALDYLARAWPVLSLCPPDHVGVRLVGHTHCDSPGKAPWHRWAEYQSHLPTEDEVREWWRRLAGCNLGLALGGDPDQSDSARVRLVR